MTQMSKYLIGISSVLVLSLSVHAEELDKTTASKVDPFSGHELQMERLNKELQLQKALVANLREALAQTSVENDIEKTKLQGVYEQKKLKKDTDKLDDSQSYSPVVPSMSILPHAASIPSPESRLPNEPKQESAMTTSTKKSLSAKKEAAKSDVLLGAIQFGNEKPSYLLETSDGKYTTTNELKKGVIQSTPSGYYTTVSESDVYQAGSGEPSNPYGRKGAYPPFGGMGSPNVGSVPIPVPQLTAPSGNGMMSPQGFNNVPTVGGY
jgi:hypothetical protein